LAGVKVTQLQSLWQREMAKKMKLTNLNENYLQLQLIMVIICKNLKGAVMKVVLLIVLLFPLLSHAGEEVYSLLIKEHRFQPAELTVPAGTKVKLLVENLDSTPEEFESHGLNREKIISGNSKATIYIGPLAPGRYTFEGEFNAKTAQGVIIAQ
jgi:hypothetical protein